MFRSPSEAVDGLRREFITVATGVAAALLALVLISLNVATYARTYGDQMAILQTIADNGGVLLASDRVSEDDAGALSGSADASLTSRHSRLHFISDFLHDVSINEKNADQVRYFSVKFETAEAEQADTQNVQAQVIDLGHTSFVDEDEAIEIASTRLSTPRAEGTFAYEDAYYAFLRTDQGDGSVLVVILNCTTEARSGRMLWVYSTGLGLTFVLAFLFVVTFASRRVTEPYTKNLESQREFVTNASHELKTPVAIIQANTELLEMVSGKSEETQAIRRQTTRLTDLINRLVALARLQETGTERLVLVDFSQTVSEVTENYQVVVRNEGKSFEAHIDKGIEVKAEPRALRELVNILVDNANKYCDPDGFVRVTLSRTASPVTKARLVISNSYAAGAGQDFRRFFERFWREDESHASGFENEHVRSGSGIGLSMAEQIVSNFHGRIRITWGSGVISFVVTL